MQVQTVQISRPQPAFGVLRGYNKTPYGDYTWGVLNGKRIEVYNAHKYNQKLIYVSDNETWRWIKSKFTYLHDKIKKVIRCSASNPNV